MVNLQLCLISAEINIMLLKITISAEATLSLTRGPISPKIIVFHVLYSQLRWIESRPRFNLTQSYCLFSYLILTKINVNLNQDYDMLLTGTSSTTPLISSYISDLVQVIKHQQNQTIFMKSQCLIIITLNLQFVNY